jgi:hypothetical protein
MMVLSFPFPQGDGSERHIAINAIKAVWMAPKNQAEVTDKNCKWNIEIDLGDSSHVSEFNNYVEAHGFYLDILRLMELTEYGD